jgi:hypothetical protein
MESRASGALNAVARRLRVHQEADGTLAVVPRLAFHQAADALNAVARQLSVPESCLRVHQAEDTERGGI